MDCAMYVLYNLFTSNFCGVLISKAAIVIECSVLFITREACSYCNLSTLAAFSCLDCFLKLLFYELEQMTNVVFQ